MKLRFTVPISLLQNDSNIKKNINWARDTSLVWEDLQHAMSGKPFITEAVDQ